MKALFISNDRSIPDVGSATRARMQAYAEEIGEMHVLLRGKEARTTTDGAITIHEVRISRLLVPFMLQRHARILIEKYALEIVSAQDPFEHGWVAMRIGKKNPNVKVHIQVHTDFLSPWFTYGYSRASVLNRVRTIMADIVLPRANGIRVVSERVKRSLIARYGSRIPDVVVIPIAAPESIPQQDTSAPPFPFTLLAVSRLESEKRVADLLRVLVEVRKRYPETGLVIAGDGRERESLRALVRVLGISSHVRFLGSRSDVRGLMRAAHVFVQASAYEGYGVTFVEAGCASLPIVTTDVGIVGDVLLPNVHVLTAHVGDVMQLARHITSLIEDNALRTSLSLAAHQAVTEHLALFQNQPAMIAADLRHTLSTT